MGLVQDKLKWGRKKAVTIIGGGSALVSIILFSSVNAIKLSSLILLITLLITLGLLVGLYYQLLA
ncbi:Neurotransmitter symporter family protein [Acinetobacter baumannii]|nr:Neurotransmitter symporter family protein [Acinetobacter baumannii]